jgi:hypothetical protein
MMSASLTSARFQKGRAMLRICSEPCNLKLLTEGQGIIQTDYNAGCETAALQMAYSALGHCVRDCDRALDLELSPAGMGPVDGLRIESVFRGGTWQLIRDGFRSSSHGKRPMSSRKNSVTRRCSRKRLQMWLALQRSSTARRRRASRPPITSTRRHRVVDRS